MALTQVYKYHTCTTWEGGERGNSMWTDNTGSPASEFLSFFGITCCRHLASEGGRERGRETEGERERELNTRAKA